LRAARREAEAVAVERTHTRLVLAASVAAAYADFGAALDRLAVTRDAVAIRRQTLELTANRVTAGLDNDGARAQAATRLALAQSDLVAAAAQVTAARRRLALLLGAGPDRGLSLTPPNIKPLPSGLPEGVSIALVARRPDIVAARLRAEATGARRSSWSYFTMPVSTRETRIYRIVQITRDAIIANGTSFFGLMASPAWVETASNPM
jgi:outer membrane protein TolC